MWLRYYDAFIERCQSQSHVSQFEHVKLWMIEYDIVVDAFMTWYDRRIEDKTWERASESHEANVPKASEHSTVYHSAH